MGSEMCIRDRSWTQPLPGNHARAGVFCFEQGFGVYRTCLRCTPLYRCDAADTAVFWWCADTVSPRGLSRTGVTQTCTRGVQRLNRRLPDQQLSVGLADLLRFHVSHIYSSHFNRCFHGVSPKGFAQFLIQNNFDKRGCVFIHLFLDGSSQSVG